LVSLTQWRDSCIGHPMLPMESILWDGHDVCSHMKTHVQVVTPLPLVNAGSL